MADIYKVAEKWMTIYIRSGPGASYRIKGVLYGKDNKEYKVTERKNKHWLHIPSIGGWCTDTDTDGLVVMKKIKNGNTKKVDPSSIKDNEKNQKKQDEESYAYVPDYKMYQSESSSQYMANLEKNFTISNLRGIFGIPYQFMSSVDPRITDRSNSIGRKYAREIVSNMPLLLLTPGKPIFMARYTKKDKKTILGNLINLASGQEDGIRNTILKDEGFGKYYSLEYAYDEYFKYVNPMCRIAARTLGVHDYEIDGVKLDKYEWSKNVNKNFNKLFSVYRHCTAWYCQSENNISESFSNETTESMLASKVNSLSDAGRELNFILGTVKSKTGWALDKFTNSDNLAKNMENVENMINTALGDNTLGGIFKSITNSAQTVIAGGKLVFPEIWAGSRFSRSYSVNLQLVSPDGDDLSVYLNIIVPMLHLLGLVLPRQAKDSIFGYISPFLVRGYYKGFFNVDMGIIENLSFSKGKESAWTISGVPTVVDVSFDIKDLYSDMYMTDMDSMKNNTLSNIILMDYISNLCGVNINDVDVYRGIDMYLQQNIKNRPKDFGTRVHLYIDQFITNKYQDIFGKF